MKNAKKPLQYYMREVHRVLGYFAIGMVMVYALSGITLIHRTGNFMKHAVEVEQIVAPGLDANELGNALKIRNFKAQEQGDDAIVWADGSYNRLTGEVRFVRHEVVEPISSLINLHKMPDAKNPHVAWVTTIFGVVLFLLALTSLFMFKPSAKSFKSNMIYTAIGVALTVLLTLLAK